MANDGGIDTDDERVRSIRQLVADTEARQVETEPLMALHTAETIIVNIAGRRVLGKDAFRAAMTQALASPLAGVHTRLEVHDIRFVRHDVAIVSCTKHVTDEREATGDEATGDDDPRLPTQGSLTYIVVEEQGEWRIALAQTTPIAGS